MAYQDPLTFIPQASQNAYTGTTPSVAPAAPGAVDTSSFTAPQLAAYNNAKALIPSANTGAVTAPAAVGVTGLTASATPLNVGAPPVPSTPSVADITAQYGTSPEVVAAKSAQAETLSKLKSLSDEEGQKSSVQAQLEDSTGYTADSATAQGLKDQITSLTAQSNEAKIAAGANADTTSFFNAQSAEIDRQTTTKMLGLSASLDAVNGNMALAEDKVQRALSAQFDPITQSISYYQSLLSVNSDDLSTAQKEEADAISTQLDAYKTQQAQAYSDKQSAYSAMLQYAPFANAATLAKMQAATNPGQVASIAAAAGINNPNGSGGSTGSSGGAATTDPIVQSWVSNVLNGNATMQQVPAAIRNAVSVGLTNQPAAAYSPLAASRFTTAATKIASNFIQLPQYQLTANGLPYLQRIDAAIQTPGSVSDQDLLDSLTKLNTAGNAISDAQVKLITGGQSFADMASTFKNKFSTGGVLSNSQRTQIQTIAKAIFANYQKGYQPVYDQVTSQLTAAGIPQAFWTIPDLNSLNAKIQTQSAGTPSNSAFVEQALTTQGLNYNTLISEMTGKAPAGTQPALDAKTGQPGFATPAEIQAGTAIPL